MSKLQPSKQIQLDMRAACQWADTFNRNKSLVHLDLSHNNLDKTEVKIMGEGLL